MKGASIGSAISSKTLIATFPPDLSVFILPISGADTDGAYIIASLMVEFSRAIVMYMLPALSHPRAAASSLRAVLIAPEAVLTADATPLLKSALYFWMYPARVV